MEKINLANLLKDCPKGMELDCTMYEDVEFDYIEQSPDSVYPIHCLIKTNGGYKPLVFTYNGCNDRHPNAKCVIFPKGKTTWEGFVPPCKFKDGNVLTYMYYNKPVIYIYRENGSCNTSYYAGYSFANERFYKGKKGGLSGDRTDLRLATEEEKQKLFDAIRANGYRWNAETKTLERLPKFKVGDWIVQKVLGTYKIVEVCESWYEVISYNNGIQYSIGFDKENDCHLWTIQDAKDGDVLALNWHEGDNSWENIIIFKKYHNKGVEGFANAPCVEGYGNTFKNGKLILYKKVSYYSKTWTDKLQPATEEEKQKLFQAIKDNGYKWNGETKTLEKLVEPKFKVGNKIKSKVLKLSINTITKICENHYELDDGCTLSLNCQDNWELVPGKFDISTLIPFESRVLIRDHESQKWRPAIWGAYEPEPYYPYRLIGTISHCCIPYEGNEHLLNTTNDCDEFYKTWE